MWDDADYGWDHELDVNYRIYVQTDPSALTITVKTKGLYGAAGHTDYAGYYIDGVSGFGQYLDIVCGGQAGFNDCSTYNNVTANSSSSANVTGAQYARTFPVVGTTVQVLQDPLWYAAKYGGFQDMNGNNVPDLQSEWDSDQDGVPDTYFYSRNPLQLQSQLASAFLSIISKAAAGTAVSVLATSSTGSGSLYQAYFNPITFDTASLNEVKWLGYLQALFVDSFGNTREDTNGDGRLVYNVDLIIQTQYDSNPASPTFGQVLVSKYSDPDGDGKADSTTPTQSGLPLSSINTIWEAGYRLSQTAPSARTLQTWVDTNNNGLVDAGEQIAFTLANDTTLAPYLQAGTAPYTADNLINFISGTQVSGLRNRQITIGGSPAVWKLGDIVDSTPTVAGAPAERYDVIYGDGTYSTFFQQYATRRQVVYAGANDGMLHAFNGGFYHAGDDPSTTNQVENGWFTRTPTDNSSGPLLGQELWGFIPYQLLPQLQWFANPNYTHVYYVDLKPKITDVRIFAPDSDHPNGWGTVLIGGFRFGGSCGSCSSGSGAPPLTMTISGQSVTFYSAYFVLDITNPEKPPNLLWSFSDPSLGLTTTYPAVARVNPSTSQITDNTNALWLLLVGSGPTGYGASSVQVGNIYAVNMATGPGTGNSLVTVFPTSDADAFMGDLASLDINLDFRTDVAYLGNTINNGSSTPVWYGKLYRLTTGGGSTSLTTWGLASGSSRAPTVLLATFPAAGTTLVGPVHAAPSLTMDDAHNLWVFFGSGRYYSQPDKTNTDTQYFFGVKDPVPGGGCTESTVTSCQKNNLLNVSNVTICVVCTGGTNQVTGVSGVTTLSGTATTTLEGLVESMDGWYTTLPTAGERSLSSPTVIGGTVFFTTFVPIADPCVASGTGSVYALYYKTGSAYKVPVIGTYASGGNTYASRSLSLGVGLPSQIAVQIGGQGQGATGTSGAQGCAGRVTGFVQGSTGAIGQFCGKPALSSWSRYISWVNQRD